MPWKECNHMDERLQSSIGVGLQGPLLLALITDLRQAQSVKLVQHHRVKVGWEPLQWKM